MTGTTLSISHKIHVSSYLRYCVKSKNQKQNKTTTTTKHLMMKNIVAEWWKDNVRLLVAPCMESVFDVTLTLHL